MGLFSGGLIFGKLWYKSKGQYLLRIQKFNFVFSKNQTKTRQKIRIGLKNQRYAWEKPSGDSKLLGIGEKVAQ